MLGYLFYPLYAIAEDRLYLALEREVKARAIECGCNSGKPFADSIAWLCKYGHRAPHTCTLLGIYRRGRNEAMHAEFQTISPPVNSIRFVERAAEVINLIFEDVDEETAAGRNGEPEHDHHKSPFT